MKYGLFFCPKRSFVYKGAHKTIWRGTQVPLQIMYFPIDSFCFPQPARHHQTAPLPEGSCHKVAEGREHPARDLSLPVSSIK